MAPSRPTCLAAILTAQAISPTRPSAPCPKRPRSRWPWRSAARSASGRSTCRRRPWPANSRCFHAWRARRGSPPRRRGDPRRAPWHRQGRRPRCLKEPSFPAPPLRGEAPKAWPPSTCPLPAGDPSASPAGATSGPFPACRSSACRRRACKARQRRGSGTASCASEGHFAAPVFCAGAGFLARCAPSGNPAIRA